jgi:acetyl-CoA carboxylase biotin carboxyl carrier protein
MSPRSKKASSAPARKESNGSSKTAKSSDAHLDDKDLRLLAKLKAVMDLLERSPLATLKYEDADVALELSKSAAPSSAPIAAPAPITQLVTPVTAPAETTTRTAAKPAAPAEEQDIHVVRSPFIGTFYRSPTPGSESFVEVGKPVRRGQTLCIVEAMKLMNEIESEVDGVVNEVLADNGKPVQYGDALFKIKVTK